MSLKSLKLYSHRQGPNPWKVAIILNELDLPYDSEYLDFPDMKKEPFESKNPNGRVPALEDPNTGITLWESGAIIEYLIDTYDKSNIISYDKSPDKYLLKTWLHYQVSGQGPYFGQATWFGFWHPEKLPSAIERYNSEVRRVTGVLNGHLKKQGSQWLVGDKCTYADLAFVPWYWLLSYYHGESWDKEFETTYPEAWAWYQRLQNRPAVTKTRDERQKAIAAAS